jgi:flagellar M-ring protein FliF
MDAINRLVKVPPQQLVGLLIAAIASIAALIGAWSWLQTPDYRVLSPGMSEKDGGAVLTALGTMNVPYKISDGGAVMVPANLVYDTRLRLASQGLPKNGSVGFELLDQQKFGTSQMQEQVNFQRGLEGELAKSIQSISSVQGARVHLAMPKPTVFLREHQKPSASVLLSLYPGKSLEPAQVAGIVHLVSSSVPDLADAGVSVIDGSGNLLSRSPQAGGLDPGQLSYVREIEQRYAQRIAAILEPIVGAGNVKAEVTADVDFNQTEQTAETFKPNGPDSVAMRSQVTGESTNSSGSGAANSGIPGAQSNTPTVAPVPAVGVAPSASNTSSKKDTTTNFEVDRKVETRRSAVGAVKRLSAAIVVNNRKVEVAPAKDGKADAKKDDAKAAPKSRPLEKAEIDQITALAREAMGFDEKRGDSLNVVNANFTQIETMAPIDVPMWKDPDNIVTAKEVGKNLGFALLAIYLVFGVLRPAVRRLTTQVPVTVTQTTTSLQPAASGATPVPALAYPEQLQRARQLARDDPKALAGLVRNWVGTNES